MPFIVDYLMAIRMFSASDERFGMCDRGPWYDVVVKYHKILECNNTSPYQHIEALRSSTMPSRR
jgi:hypothetical protein